MRLSELFQKNNNQINELTDNPYPYSQVAGNDVIYQFKTENGLTYEVDIANWGDDVFEISFSLEKDGKSETGITGTGNSFKVLSTIADIVRNFIKQNDPLHVQFTSDPRLPSRTKLYKRIATQLDKEFSDYYLDTKAAGNAAEYFFILKRRRPTSSINESINVDAFKEILKKFLPLAKKVVKLDKMPEIILKKTITHGDQPTMGRFHSDRYTLEIAIANRQPVDILRTLAHELVHAKQVAAGVIVDPTTGSKDENEANVLAGIVMRHFNKKYPEYLSVQPLEEGINNGRKRICRQNNQH